MRLPGTRYQEHGWEQVRKLLGHCSLQAFRQIEMHHVLQPAQHAALLDAYTDAVAASLHAHVCSARGTAEGNSYGESVYELSLGLLYELQAQTTYWTAFIAAMAGDDEQQFRQRVISGFQQGEALDRMIDAIKAVAESLSQVQR